ncbi:MAG TPA: hypothetical protein VIC34_13900 [Croceibacterium sp.]
MRTINRSLTCATAAIAAVLALSATPLAAQSAPADPTVSVQPQPVEPSPVASPAPTIDVPDATTAPAASGASAEVQPVPEASAPTPHKVTTTTRTATSRTTMASVAPAAPSVRHTTVTRSTTVAQGAPAAVAAAPIAAVPAPANDTALPADTTDAAPPIAANPDTVAQPNEPRGITGTMGVIALAVLAMIIALVGLMVFRRRSPVTTQVVETPATTSTLAEPAPPVAEPIAASQAAVMATPTPIGRRDTAPVRGALPSAGASVDLPAKLPETYEERSALLDKMVAAKPDKANPFTDRRQRLHRARLIMQSLGVTFDHEPRIDLSQYPNNWPELQRPYYKAA